MQLSTDSVEGLSPPPYTHYMAFRTGLRRTGLFSWLLLCIAVCGERGKERDRDRESARACNLCTIVWARVVGRYTARNRSWKQLMKHIPLFSNRQSTSPPTIMRGTLFLLIRERKQRAGGEGAKFKLSRQRSCAQASSATHFKKGQVGLGLKVMLISRVLLRYSGCPKNKQWQQ